jgi:hypothetical protein
MNTIFFKNQKFLLIINSIIIISYALFDGNNHSKKSGIPFLSSSNQFHEISDWLVRMFSDKSGCAVSTQSSIIAMITCVECNGSFSRAEKIFNHDR